ncbi:hypothetical protein V6N13_065550 [Hibiscus sabdariffa]
MRGIWWISCVWVVLNPAKPLRRCVFLGSLGFDSTLCHIQYERLPLFCHQCSIIGHPTSSCTLVQGDWLRATTPKSPFGNSRSRGRIRYHDKPIKESGFIQSAAKNASTSNFSNLGGTSSAVSVDVVAPIELESTAADSSTSGSALHEVPITVRPGLDHVATIQAPSVAVVADHELLVAAAADLAEPIAVAAESFVPFDMVGSLLAAVALLFDSDDGALSNVDPILPVIRNDVVLVVDLVDDQGKATSSIIAVNGHSVNGDDGNVLASHANEVCVRKRSLVSSRSVHAKRHRVDLFRFEYYWTDDASCVDILQQTWANTCGPTLDKIHDVGSSIHVWQIQKRSDSIHRINDLNSFINSCLRGQGSLPDLEALHSVNCQTWS